jgi:hypothetical protein
MPRKRANKKKGKGPLVRKTPAATTVISRPRNVPAFTRAGKKIIFSNEERFTSIEWPDGGAGIDGYSVSPGRGFVFPWLSKVAPHFQFWRMRKCRFEYRPCSAATSSGGITLAFDYDADAGAPSTVEELAAYAGARQGSIREPLSITLDPQWISEPRYVRNAAKLSEDGSLRWTDLGVILWATEGNNSGSVLTGGTLWVCYEVELWCPQIPWRQGDALKIEGSGTMNADNPFGTTGGTLDTDSTLPGYTAKDAGGHYSRIVLPESGAYIVETNGKGTAISAVSVTGSSGVTVSTIQGTINGTETEVTTAHKVEVDRTASSDDAYVEWGPTATAITEWVVRIAKYVSGLD